MANTFEIDVTADAWTEVATGPARGFMTNDGIVKILYRENDSLPDPTDMVAHNMEKDVGAFVSFNVLTGQNVYVRSVDHNSKVAITLES